MARQVQRLTQRTFEYGMAWPPMKGDTLRLYSMRFCPYAQRARLVLAHKNIPYETVNCHLKRKPTWLKERNPKGRVPVLEYPDGRILYESVWVCQYIDEVFPEDRLTPTDPFRKARDMIMVDFCEKLMTSMHQRWGSESAREKAEATFLKGFNIYNKELESRLPDGPFFGGKQPAMADYLIWPWLERVPIVDDTTPANLSNSNTEIDTYHGKARIAASKFPVLYKWMEAMFELPAVKETMFDLESHLQYSLSHKTSDPDYDMGLEDEPPLPSVARL